jgi:hypothetical protein
MMPLDMWALRADGSGAILEAVATMEAIDAIREPNLLQPAGLSWACRNKRQIAETKAFAARPRKATFGGTIQARADPAVTEHRKQAGSGR